MRTIKTILAVLFLTSNSYATEFNDLRCVATAVYQEAGSEIYTGKIAVARVIQNRIKKNFAKTPCLVVYQKLKNRCQFTWTCRDHQLLTKSQCSDCWRAARDVFDHQKYQNLIPEGVFFHAVYVNPHWNFKKLGVIGKHKFYGFDIANKKYYN